LFYSSVFLVGTGLFVFTYSFLTDYYTGAFLGSMFAVLSIICMLFIYKDYLYTAKLLWGIGTPLLIIIAPVFYSVHKTSTLFSLGDALIGAALFVIYSFHEKHEKLGMWICIVLFMLSIIFYDQIIIHHSVPGLDYSFVANNYIHFKVTQVFHFISLVYLILLVKISKGNIEKKLAEQIIRFKEFTANLLRLSKTKSVHSGIISESLKEIAPFAAINLNVSRVSIWEYDEEIQAIKSLVCYDGSKHTFLDPIILYRKDFPVYFSHLLSEKMIVADNASENEKTSEFKESYLIPNAIKSMMDFPFFIDGKFKGIMCCEEQRNEKTWTEIDILFAQTITMYISIIFYCANRKEQNDTLKNINSKILNENDSLLNDLDWKSQNLAQMRNFLNDLSFKNAHHLRGPLSRILGLLFLYKKDDAPENRELYVEYISQSATEMDQIIREIGQVLNSRI
jgi:hypothetical protein